MRTAIRRSNLSSVSLRIGLTKLPELINEVVRSMFEPGEAEFVEFDARRSPAEPPTPALLHAVVAGVSGPLEPDVVAIAQGHPRTVVLGLRTDGRQSWLYEFLPHPRALGELGPHELRAALVSAVQIHVT